MKKILILSLLGICFSNESVLCAVGLPGVWGGRHKDVTADETAVYLQSLDEEATNKALKDIKEKCQNLRSICILDCTINEDSAEYFSAIVRNNSRLQIVNFSRSEATTHKAQARIAGAVLANVIDFKRPICVSLPRYNGRTWNTENLTISRNVLALQNENCKSSHSYGKALEYEQIEQYKKLYEGDYEAAEKEYTAIYRKTKTESRGAVETAHEWGIRRGIAVSNIQNYAKQLQQIEELEKAEELSRMRGKFNQVLRDSFVLLRKLGQEEFSSVNGKDVPPQSSSPSSDSADSDTPLLSESRKRSKEGSFDGSSGHLSDGLFDEKDEMHSGLPSNDLEKRGLLSSRTEE